LAFFEIPNLSDIGRDEKTPAWVQHLALAANTDTPKPFKEHNMVGPAMVDEWSKTKHGPRHTVWLHEQD